jgi:YVTN family beta-propeller protein
VIAKGSVWVANEGDDTVSRIDPENGKVTETEALQHESAPTSVATYGDHVWVINELGDAVTRLTPRD